MNTFNGFEQKLSYMPNVANKTKSLLIFFENKPERVNRIMHDGKPIYQNIPAGPPKCARWARAQVG